MTFSVKRLSLLVLGVLLVVSLTACGSSGSKSSSNSSSSSTSKKVNLTLWETWTDNTAENRAYKSMVSEFTKNNPNINITLQTTANNQYRTKMKTEAAGKQLPDIFLVWPGSELTPLVQGKTVQPIDDVLKNLNVTIPKSTLAPFAVNGKQYGIPTTVSYTSVIYYNKKDLQSVGYSSFPTTYKDFKTLIGKLKAKGMTPIELGDKPQWPLQSCYMSQIGQRMTGSDFLANVQAGKAKFTDPNFIKALGIVKQMNDIGAFNKDVNTIDDAQARDNFLQGKASMLITGSWATTGILQNKPKDLQVAAAKFPSIAGGKGDSSKVTGVGSMAFGLNSNLSGQKLTDAKKFLNFFYSKELYTKLIKGGSVVAANLPVPSDATSLFKDVVNATQGGTAPVYDATLSATETDTINNGLQGIITGSTTPQKLAQQMQSQLGQ